MLERSDVLVKGGGRARRARLATLYSTHFQDVWRWLAALGVPAADVPDLTQDVFVAAYRALDGFEGRASERTWLFGIASNLASARRRKASTRREVLDDAPDPPDEGRGPDGAVELRQAHDLLTRALASLPEEQRVTFTLYELAGYTGQAIAELMGVPEQTVYWRLRAAREHVLRVGEKARGVRRREDRT